MFIFYQLRTVSSLLLIPLYQALSLVCVCVCVCVYLYIWGGGYLIHMEERGQGGEEKESRRENRRK